MRRRKVGVAVAMLTLLSAPAVAQSRNACLDAKDYSKAIKACSDVIRTNPKDAVAYRMRGDALAKNGDTGQAIADYTKAIQLNPTYVPAYNSRATAFVNKGDYTRAVADATKASELRSQRKQQVKALPPVRAKPKASSWASAKGGDKKGETPFNPFPDAASPQ
jgi:tetratricopeptide (TPR) repeat protein